MKPYYDATLLDLLARPMDCDGAVDLFFMNKMIQEAGFIKTAKLPKKTRLERIFLTPLNVNTTLQCTKSKKKKAQSDTQENHDLL
ncbi:hypothetical protein NDU88_005389 [Pleurodeles waltl]|uniref:Uncharacterized protein n=1 Tax=Pleurodeles waltl TaxID=8319 RepID=A0AAV7RN56_PLEWA|nr:hypothetical protein NDU88_005389 [Pleurodeles waltl]